MKKFCACILISLTFAITAIAQREVNFMIIVDEDVQYFKTNPETLKREPGLVDKKIGVVFSVPIFEDLYAKLERRSVAKLAATQQLFVELLKNDLLKLIYLERGQSGQFLMLRSTETSFNFDKQLLLLFEAVEKYYQIELVLGPIEIPAQQNRPVLNKDTVGFPSWTIPFKKPILTAQVQAQTLAVTRVAREENPIK